MALVPSGNGSGWFLTVSLTDTQSDVSVKEYELRAVDLAGAQASVANILGALANVTDSVVSATSLSFRQYEDAFSYPVGADNSTKARISYRIDGSNENETFNIPAPKNALFVAPSGPSNNVVNVSNADLLVYSGLFLNGGDCFISDGESLDAMNKGRRVTVKKSFTS